MNRRPAQPGAIAADLAARGATLAERAAALAARLSRRLRRLPPAARLAYAAESAALAAAAELLTQVMAWLADPAGAAPSIPSEPVPGVSAPVRALRRDVDSFCRDLGRAGAPVGQTPPAPPGRALRGGQYEHRSQH